MLSWDAVVATLVALRLGPEVLDSIDVIELIGEQFGVVDPHGVELGDVEHIVAFESDTNRIPCDCRHHEFGPDGVSGREEEMIRAITDAEALPSCSEPPRIERVEMAACMLAYRKNMIHRELHIFSRQP